LKKWVEVKKIDFFVNTSWNRLKLVKQDLPTKKIGLKSYTLCRFWGLSLLSSLYCIKMIPKKKRTGLSYLQLFQKKRNHHEKVRCRNSFHSVQAQEKMLVILFFFFVYPVQNISVHWILSSKKNKKTKEEHKKKGTYSLLSLLVENVTLVCSKFERIRKSKKI